MNTILVPIDFSPASHNAADYAAMLAKQMGTDVFLLHVFTEPLPVEDAGIPLAAVSIELREEYAVRLDVEIKRLARKYGVRTKGKVIGGFTGIAIKQMAEDLNAGIICLGREAKHYNSLFGSTILKTIRKTNTPVLVVPEGVAYQIPKRIVMAVDFRGMLHRDRVATLFNIIKTSDSSLRVLHIEKKEEMLLPEEVPERLQLGRVLSRISYVYEKVENKNIGEGILKFISDHPTDLLVMVVHHHNFVARLISDVHTAPLAFSVNIPLLILKNQSSL
jgi:nucleotide-binding universal stress UspA family protein